MDPDRSHLDRTHSLSLRRLPTFDYTDPDHAYFVTVCARHETPFVDHRLAREVIGSLQWMRLHRDLLLYAYCLMPDHLHLLLRLPEGSQSLGGVMRAFKTFTTRQSWELGYQGVLWQARFYDHIVRRSETGERIVEYILENPVRKGLVAEATEYAWSSAPDPM